MPKTIRKILQDVQNRPLPYIVQIVSLLVLGLATYITFRLVPIWQGIDSLNFRVQAIETRNETVDPLVNEFIEQKGDIKAIKNDIVEIKQDIKDIKNFLNVR